MLIKTLKKAYCLLLFILFTFYTGYSQEKIQKKQFKYGVVNPEEFKLRASGKDSASSALVLFDVGECYFELDRNGRFVYVFERHIRYKINNKTAYDLANYQLELYRGSAQAKETLHYMEAATYNLANNKVLQTKIPKSGRFTEEYNEKYTLKKFSLPEVKENSIIEYKYKIVSDFIFTLREWKFQSEIPSLYSEYNIKVPEYMQYKISLSGYFPVQNTLNTDINANYLEGLPASANHTQYIALNIPAISREPYITTLEDYIPKLSFELKLTRFPDQILKDYNSTWPKVVKDLVGEDNFGGFIKKISNLRKLLSDIVGDEQDSLKKTEKIFSYVKQNIK